MTPVSPLENAAPLDGVVHDEHELRYLRPDGFVVPERLVGLVRLGTRRTPHVDRYLEARAADGRPALRAGGHSLRVRELADGTFVATLKTRIAQRGPRVLRREVEAQRPRGLATSLGELLAGWECAPLTGARELAQGAPLAALFAVHNDRREHHYGTSDGALVVLSEDFITYPDASTEERVEVEALDGAGALLDSIHRHLQARWPSLRPCKRGKYSEARRRLGALLAAV